MDLIIPYFLTSLVLLEAHVESDLSKALTAHVDAIFSDKRLMAATPAAHVSAAAKFLA
jgi:hypothetical protein